MLCYIRKFSVSFILAFAVAMLFAATRPSLGHGPIGAERNPARKPGADFTVGRKNLDRPIVPSAVYLVTNTNDSGAGSLRQAILDANASAGADQIQFSIAPNDGTVKTISLSSPLPIITDTVAIDGYTQPQATPNTLATGNNAVVLIAFNSGGNGLSFNAGASGSMVRGLSVSASSVAINLDSTTNVLVEGNRIGVNAAGTTGVNFSANNTGVAISEGSTAASGNVIGGASPAQRNVIGAVGTGISISRAPSSAGANSIVNNYIGVTASGTAGQPGNGGGFNTYGVNLNGGAAVSVTGNVIGSASIGVSITNVTAGAVRGNLIGTNATGTAALANGSGVYIVGTGQTIVGGTTASDRNVISGNSVGVDINADGQTVQGNYIGTTADGASSLPNAVGVKIGSRFFNGSITSFNNCIVGASTSGGAGGNRIAYNTGGGPATGGIVVLGGVGNRFLSNSIYANTNGSSGLGIDLGNDGVTPNDAGDADGGANNLQNYPVISSVNTSGATTTVNGTLNSLPNTSFVLEFFSSTAPNPTGFGEGQTFLGEPASGSRNVTTNAQGDAAFSLTFNAIVTPPQVITATATNTTTNDTSEFSRALTVAQTFVVNSVSDTDDGRCDALGTGAGNLDCTLREAINAANSSPAQDTIAFNIPGGGVKTINNTSFSYNSLTDTSGVIIDGYTQPGASANTLAVGTNAALLIEVHGMPNNPNNTQSAGFNLASSNNLLRGLVINGFSFQIVLTGTNNRIEGCYVGTNPAGTSASGASTSGIIDGGNIPLGTDLQRQNVLGGAQPAQRNLVFNGIRLVTGGNVIQNNYVGTNAAGTSALSPGNGGGIALNGNGNLIGGANPGQGNLISGNATGVSIGSNFSNLGNNNTIQGNLIGTDATGQAAIPNNTAGVQLSNFGNIIGGTSAGARNIISGNGLSSVPGPGIQLGANSTITGGTIVQGNLIGVAADGTTPLGNTGSGVLLIGAATSTIGAATPVGAGGNVIANNGFNTSPQVNSAGDGIHIEDTAINFNNARIAAVNNRLNSNSIYNNARLGINLIGNDSGNGVTPNDVGDSDSGPNNLQNFPVINFVRATSAGATRITGTLNSTASRQFAIEVYSTPAATAADAEGQTLLGTFTVTTDASGNATFDQTFNNNTNGLFLTATATDLATNDTSEFSQAVQSLLPTASTATIGGQVTNTEGNPLAGVILQLSGTRSARTITDAHGNYYFDGLESEGFYTISPMLANYSFGPSERSFSVIGNKTEAAFTATPYPVATANPLNTDLYFVRQQYLDFLGREPDRDGLLYWASELNKCGTDTGCLSNKRTGIAAAFFVEQEYQQTGSFVYRLYKGGLGRQLSYDEFSADRQKVLGGDDLETSKVGFAGGFVQRAEFVQKYGQATSAETFVDSLLASIQQTSGVNLSNERGALITRYNSGLDINQSRALVLRKAIDETAFKDAVYNSSFVMMEYFGYLKRDPEQEGFDFWLNVLNNREPNNYRAMVCAFITSAEYQKRFSPVVTHSNQECR
jgi:CSLREA domain-containing protein